MAEKGKPHSAGAKAKPDKARTSSRPPGRQSKKPSPKTPRHTSARATPIPDEASVPEEPLDAGAILNDLLDRVLAECALAAVVRQRVPFSVSRARDAILFVAEWRFLARDEGDRDPEGDPNPEGDPDPERDSNREGDTDPERDGIWSEDEEPQTCPLDSRTPCAVPVYYEDSQSSKEREFEDLPETAEAETLLARPGEEPDAVPVPDVPLLPEQVPGDDIDVSVPGPSRPEPPSAPRPPERGRRLSRDTGKGGILAQPPEKDLKLSRDTGRDGIPAQPPEKDRRLSRDTGKGGILAPRSPEKGRRLSGAPGIGSILAQPPERRHRFSWGPGPGSILAQPPKRGSQPSQPPQPRPAPQDVPQPRAPLPTAPSEPPAQPPPVSHEGTARVTHQVPPPPPTLAPMPQRRPSRGTGVPRLAARRLVARWVLPEVKVVDVSSEPDWGRAAPSRSRLVPPGVPQVPQVIPATGRTRKAEPQLCDPWLASARLAPGVTVRWGRSERRGPALPGHGGREDDEEADEVVRKADKELKPILAYPECRLSEYDE